jgi:predicted dehydrogenase
MLERIRIGVVGTGRMATTMVRVMRQLPHYEIVSVASKDPSRASNFARVHGVPKAGTIEHLLGDPQVRAVYIANHTRNHAETAVAALRSGKAVLCEKPFAISLAEGEAVVNAARENGQLFMEALWTPFLPAYRRLMELSSSNTFGAPRMVTYEFGYPATPQSHPSLYDVRDGGVLRDRSIYGTAFAIDALGSVRDVQAVVAENSSGIGTIAAILLTHRNGGMSQISLSMASLLTNTATLSCERGVIGLKPSIPVTDVVFYKYATAPLVRDQAEAGQSDARRSLTLALKRFPLLRFAKRIVPQFRSEHYAYGISPYEGLLRHFSSLIREGRSSSTIVPPAKSLEYLQVLERATASAKSNAWGPNA